MMAHLDPSDPASPTQAIPTDPISTAAQEIHAEEQSIPIEDVLRQAWEKVEDYHHKVSAKIHRFPASLREYCEDHQYIAPKMVAMGPYHRHLPEVLEMEEVKKAAAHHFCKVANCSPETAYQKVVAVAGDAQSCYDAGSLQGIGDADFTSMMFHDACFLLLYILVITEPTTCPQSLVCRTGANKHVIATDMFLLENQIPWVVVDALMTLRTVKLSMFIATMGMNIQSRVDRRARPLDLSTYKPPHFLGLFHFYQSGLSITKSPRGLVFSKTDGGLGSLVSNPVEDLDLEDFVSSSSHLHSSINGERYVVAPDEEMAMAAMEEVEPPSHTPLHITQLNHELPDADLQEEEDYFVSSSSHLHSSISEEKDVVAPDEEMAMAATEEVEPPWPDISLPPDPEVEPPWISLPPDPDARFSGEWFPTNDPRRIESPEVHESLPLGTSAVELAEIGIKLTPSKTAEFKDIGLTEGLLVRKLFLPSLHLNENTACWLLNMAAFETCTTLEYSDYTVGSYMSLFAMLMDREEDVHELRAKRLIHGEFTNKQTLDYFKGRHASNMPPGYKFYAILRRIEDYKQSCRLWITIHRFVYNNLKTIVAVLSIIGVLVPIFKTLLDLKKH